jgi:hypothetical protein
LNPRVYTDQYSPDFIERDGKYTSPDPRLMDPMRNTRKWLDRPPINGHVNMDDVYNEKLANYGENYGDYSTVNTGQIMYYNDKSIENPFFYPVFEQGSTVEAKLYRDPMGSIQPIYDWKACPVKRDIPYTEKSLSSIEDSQFHRQDIMSTQMRQTNRSRYAPRWFANWS